MCDQFHDGTGFLTHHLALTNSFEVSKIVNSTWRSLSHPLTHSLSRSPPPPHTHTHTHSSLLLYFLALNLYLHLTLCLNDIAQILILTGCNANCGSIGHSAVLGFHHRGPGHQVSVGLTFIQQHRRHFTVLLPQGLLPYNYFTILRCILLLS